MKEEKKSKFKKCPKCKKITTLMICECGFAVYKMDKKQIIKKIKDEEQI